MSYPVIARGAAAEPWVDAGKAVASQLIVWHHLVHYGPLAERARAWAPRLLDWLDQRALLAVQVFLVMGGYLAARSLWPRADQPRAALADWPRLVARRWRRLLPLYAAALLLAMLAAALARHWMLDPDTPAAPTWPQWLAHLLLLQDVVGQPALSAGVWYVAIDLQLFALLAALAGAATLWRRHGRAAPGALRWGAGAGVALLAGLALASLAWFNRQPGGDVWAPYFFGSYALGVLAAWGVRDARRAGWCALMVGLAAAGLWLQWRDRLALALGVALLLLWQPARARLAALRVQPLLAGLAAISYALFLVHYPVSLAVNAAALRWLPGSGAATAVAGLLGAWLLSLGTAWALWRLIERQGWRRVLRLRAAVVKA